MHTLRRAILVGAILSTVSFAHAQVEGLWKTQEGYSGGYALVNIMRCDKEICGTLVDIIGNEEKSSLGKTIIKEMKDNGDGTFDGGQIYAPDEQKWYKSKMVLSGDKLTVQGCITIIIDLCRSQTWTRQ